MSINATCNVQVQLTGEGLGGGAQPYLTEQSPANAAAPPPTSVLLAPGANTFTCPAGFTIQGVALSPPPGSVNAKTLKGNGADVGLGNWTAITAVIPATAGEIITVVSTGTEMLKIAFF